MPFDERQQRLLRGMGVRLWQPAPSTLPSPGQTSGAVAGALADVAPLAATRPEPTPPAASAAVTDSRAQRIAALDWDSLRTEVAQCQACGLCQSRTQTVFGVGHPRARWLIVGEAPGEQEDLKGEPFVGAAGVLLDQMLRALRLSRQSDGPPEQRVHIVNTLKCRPPRNRNPAPEELALCEPFLQRQIELLAPSVIIAMGRFAVQSLLRSADPIGRLRGRVHKVQGIPTVVTYHPPYLLRAPADKQRAWDDLCLAAEAFSRTRPSPAPAT